MNKLEIGRHYGAAFGIGADEHDQRRMIYRGGNTWECILRDGTSKTVESEDTTRKAQEYYGTSIRMGM